MSEGDPFSFGDDEDRTVIRPIPGGKSPLKAPEKRTQPAFSVPAYVPDYGNEPPTQGGSLATRFVCDLNHNPVVTAALPLLSLAGRLRNSAIMNSVEALQQRMAEEVREFENKILRSGTGQEQCALASYALCTFLDEVVLQTPWGQQSAWGHQSLLVTFHNEGWGGERFFEHCNKAVRQPGSYQHLLEFYYLLLSLGLEGKYRRLAQGANSLEQMRSELYQLVQRLQGDYERELSPRWRGLKDLRPALMRFVPLWVIGALAAAVLLLVYLGFALSINGASDPAFQQLSKLGADDLQLAGAQPKPISLPPQRVARFKQLLGREIDANMVEVVDDNVLRVRNSFNSGSDQLKPEFLPMLNKIARELVAGGDRALVTGHTDDKPIVSARFPSNWHLSNSRAKHVADILMADNGMRGKVKFEGRADGEPLSPNDTSEHRALNRRVDILIQ